MNKSIHVIDRNWIHDFSHARLLVNDFFLKDARMPAMSSVETNNANTVTCQASSSPVLSEHRISQNVIFFVFDDGIDMFHTRVVYKHFCNNNI